MVSEHPKKKEFLMEVIIDTWEGENILLML